MSDPDPAEAIRPILDSFRRGTKRAKLRLLAVACSNGHSLLEVFPTSSGPVALWAERVRWSTEGDKVTEHRPAKVEWNAAFVDDSDERAMVFCRCTEATGVELEWVADQLAAGLRRVVVASG